MLNQIHLTPEQISAIQSAERLRSIDEKLSLVETAVVESGNNVLPAIQSATESTDAVRGAVESLKTDINAPIEVIAKLEETNALLQAVVNETSKTEIAISNFPAFPEQKEFPAFPEQKEVDFTPLIEVIREEIGKLEPDEVDTESIVSAITSVEKRLSEFSFPKQNDYSDILKKIVSALERPEKTDKDIISAIKKIWNSDDISNISEWLKMIYEKKEKFTFDKDGQLIVKIGGGMSFGGGGLSGPESAKLQTLATEAKQDALSAYAPAGQDIAGDPMYFAGLKADGSWYIKKMYLSGDYTSKYANGTSGFNWSTRASLSYADFNTLTW